MTLKRSRAMKSGCSVNLMELYVSSKKSGEEIAFTGKSTRCQSVEGSTPKNLLPGDRGESCRFRIKKQMSKLLIIDPHFVASSPAMKSLYRSVEELTSQGYELEVWCLKSDYSGEDIQIRRFFCPFNLWFLESIYFWIFAHLFWVCQFKLLRKKVPEVSVATSFYCVFAKVAYIHFLFDAYAESCCTHQEAMKLSFPRKVQLSVARFQEFFLWRSNGCSEWWIVSEGVAEYARSRDKKNRKLKVLPNSFDTTRFNRSVSLELRDSWRAKLGFEESDFVFCFVGLGDFERKGIGLALEVVTHLRRLAEGSPDTKNFRLLVLGGKTEQPEDLSKFLSRCGVEGNEVEFLSQFGRVSDIRPYLAASEALLFTSFFEAFALVEIEAAAMGLELFLTPHFGSEMILGQGGRGCVIPWDPKEAAELLFARIQAETDEQKSGEAEMGGALSLSQYRARIGEFVNSVASEHQG